MRKQSLGKLSHMGPRVASPQSVVAERQDTGTTHDEMMNQLNDNFLHLKEFICKNYSKKNKLRWKAEK